MAKIQKFCSINKFLDIFDKKLYSVIDDLCLHRIFSPKRNRGITFLYPGDEKYRNEIIEAAYGKTPEKAIQMLQSLIILDYLPTPADFYAKKDDIPNALHKKIMVESVTKDVVKLASGGTLEVEESFHPIDTRPNMAVYVLKGGKIPLDAEESKIKANKKTTTGSAEMDQLRCKFVHKLEDKFRVCLCGSDWTENPYFEAVVSFYMWCLNNQIDLTEINKNMDWCPIVSFYLVFEPHSCNPSVVSKEIFNRWVTSTGGKCPIDSNKIVQIYDFIMKKASENQQDIEAKISERAILQEKLLKEPFKPTLSENALKYYNSDLNRAFKDECRFLIYQYVLDIADYVDSPVGRCASYDNLLTFVRYFASVPPKDPTDLLCLNQSLQNRTDPAAWVSSAYGFIRSDAFLHILVPPELISLPKLGITKIDGPNLTSNALVNLSHMKRETLSKCIKSTSLDLVRMQTLCSMVDQIKAI